MLVNRPSWATGPGSLNQTQSGPLGWLRRLFVGLDLNVDIKGGLGRRTAVNDPELRAGLRRRGCFGLGFGLGGVKIRSVGSRISHLPQQHDGTSGQIESNLDGHRLHPHTAVFGDLAGSAVDGVPGNNAAVVADLGKMKAAGDAFRVDLEVVDLEFVADIQPERRTGTQMLGNVDTRSSWIKVDHRKPLREQCVNDLFFGHLMKAGIGHESSSGPNDVGPRCEDNGLTSCRQDGPRSAMRVLVWLLAALVIGLSLPAGVAEAGEISWAFPLEEGHVAFIEVRTPDEAIIGQFKVADQIPWSRFGWRPDLDDERGRVSGRVGALFLPEGRYLVDLVLPKETLRQVYIADEAPSQIEIILPEGGDSVVAWARDAEAGNNGLSWAKGKDGRVILPIGEGEWDVYATGEATLPGRYPTKDGSAVRLALAPPQGKVVPVEQETGLLRAILLPMTLLLLVMGTLALVAVSKKKGFFVASLASLGLSGYLCKDILVDLFHTVPCRFPRNYKDPFDSVFFAASFEDSMLRFSDVTQMFAYPDGASWIGTGPAWLAYLVSGLLSHPLGPVAGNNVAVVLLLAALGVSVWALARELGAGPWTAVLAGGAALISPLVLSEIDKASLDRLVLFPIPLFFLCLNRAVERVGWRWPIYAGVALAGVFYGQVYYGIYLAAACPLLVVYRLIGEDFKGRFARVVVVGLVGGALIAPGLYLLRAVTAGSSYDSGSFGLLLGDSPLWPPVPLEEANAYFESHDIRLVTDPGLMDISQQPDIPMDTPQNRFLAAANSGMFLEDFIEPINHLPGEDRYWILIGLSLLLAVRRKATLIVTLDVALLIAYSLGPMLRTQAEATMVPLPYYLNLLFIPGFDQLKNIYRYRLMAATICAVPMALALEGVFSRIAALKAGGFSLPRLGLVELGVAGYIASLLVAGSFQWPTPYTYTRSSVIETMEPAPAVLLPMEATLDDPSAMMAVVNRGIPVVNEMPLEPLRRSSGSAAWFEQIGLLGRLAELSGARRPNRWVPMVNPDDDRAWLDRHGIRYVILFRRLVPGVEFVGRTTAFMDEAFERVGQDGSVTVWDLSRPKEGTWAGLASAENAKPFVLPPKPKPKPPPPSGQGDADSQL